jgi:hypothetical protein
MFATRDGEVLVKDSLQKDTKWYKSEGRERKRKEAIKNSVHNI